MPPGRYSSQGAFDIEILNPQALHTPDGLQTALRAIEAVCYRDDPKIAGMVEALNSHSYLLEYIISGKLVVPKNPRTLLALIHLPSSVGGGGVREVLKVDNHGISHIRRAKYERHEYATPPETFILTAIRKVSIHCRCTPQPPRIPEKGGTLVQCSKDS
jgi:hypothetical protein